MYFHEIHHPRQRSDFLLPTNYVCAQPDCVSGSLRLIDTNFSHSIDWAEAKPRTSSNISLHYNYHSSSFFTSSSALLLSFIHLSSAHTFTNPIRDSLPHKPQQLRHLGTAKYPFLIPFTEMQSELRLLPIFFS